MAKKPSMNAMVASMPTAGSMGMLWYTTSSVKNGRSASASCLAKVPHMSRTTRSASSAEVVPMVTSRVRVSVTPYGRGRSRIVSAISTRESGSPSGSEATYLLVIWKRY